MRLSLIGCVWLLVIVVRCQASETCEVPAEIEAQWKSKALAPAQNFRGVWLAKNGELQCGILAFESALRAEPGFLEARYNLGLALLDDRQFGKAAHEFGLLMKQLPKQSHPHLGLGMALSELGRLPEAESELRAALLLDPDSPQVRRQLGIVLTRERRYTAAITFLREAVAREPNEVENQLALAEALYSNGASADAIQVLQKTVIAQPQSAAAQSNLGTLFAREKRYPEAVDHFQAALELNSDDDVTRLSLVKALIGLDRQAEAIPLTSTVILHRPRDAEARYLRGFAHRGLGDYDQAESDLLISVEVDPSYYPAQYNLGAVLLKLGKYDEAFTHLSKATQLEPSSQEAQFQLASVLRHLNRPENARKELADFGERKKRDQIANIASMTAGLANQSLVEGDAQAAIANYEKALKLDPSNAKTYYNLALGKQKLHDSAGALAALERSVALDANFARARGELGLLYLGQGRNTEAERQFKAALLADPQCAECQNNLGVLYGQQPSGSQRAEQLFREAIENSPTYGQARVNLALILAGRADFPAARHELETVLATEPNNLKALTALGMVQGRTGDGGAADTLLKVVALDPKSAEAHLNLGIALADSGRAEQALTEFSEATRHAPRDAASHANKGRVLVQLHRYQDALPEIELAATLDPSTSDTWYRLGIARRELQQYERAVEALQQSLKLAPSNSDAAYLLGQSCQSLGRIGEALTAWKSALRNDPHNKQALYSLMRATAKSNPPESARYREKLTELQLQQGGEEQAKSLSNLSIVSAKEGNWKDAIAKLQQAIATCGACASLAQLHKNLGLTECQAGQLEEGEKELRLALKEMPGDSEILRALEILGRLRATAPAR